MVDGSVVTAEGVTRFRELLSSLPEPQYAIHDIHLTFKSEGIWGHFYQKIDDRFIKPNSRDVFIHPTPRFSVAKYSHEVKIIAHMNDTVSIKIPCSDKPFTFDYAGIMALTELMVETQINLLRRIALANDPCKPILRPTVSKYKIVKFEEDQMPRVPNYNSWVVKMWHFGKDKPVVEYSDRGYQCTWYGAIEELYRIYIKKMHGMTFERREKQEYPNQAFLSAVRLGIERQFRNNSGPVERDVMS
jgi:hypothetical protein